MTLAPGRFAYAAINDRPVIKWPNNARVAFWVAPNIEFYEYLPLRSPTRPDVASYSYRDRGNRHGFWRMLEVMDQHHIRCCVCLNAGVLDHCPEIREAMVARNWGFTDPTHFTRRFRSAYGLTPSELRRLSTNVHPASS